MPKPLIAIVGDITDGRLLSPPSSNPTKAKKAAEELGIELAKRNTRLLVYGGPFLETDVVRGFVSANPKQDKCILMWFSKDNEPPAFPEELSNPKLFERRAERGADWEVAFYRAITKADGLIIIGGGNATKISGLVAIGSRMPIMALPEFGGGAAKVWESLSAGEDLPTRDEINLMAKRWSNGSAEACVIALLNQDFRRKLIEGTPKPIFAIVAGLLFITALAIVPWIWGLNSINVWMLFLVPLIAGGAGAAIRPMVDRQRGVNVVAPAVLATIVLGMVAGGISGVLFVSAQLTADPDLARTSADYAGRSIPFGLGVGFIAGLTSDVVFGKLLSIDVVRSAGTANQVDKI